jgi:hypothetical protein
MPPPRKIICKTSNVIATAVNAQPVASLSRNDMTSVSQPVLTLARN